jgi:hypothetical protein
MAIITSIAPSGPNKPNDLLVFDGSSCTSICSSNEALDVATTGASLAGDSASFGGGKELFGDVFDVWG